MVPIYTTTTLFLRVSSNSSNIGKKINCGLPNISGYTTHPVHVGGVMVEDGFIGHGAYSSAILNKYLFSTSPGSYQGLSKFEFDASRSNSIYGSSTEVLPNSCDTAYAIYLGNIS